MIVNRRASLGLFGAALVAPLIPLRADPLDDKLGDPVRATDLFVRLRTRGPDLWGTWTYSGVFIIKPEGQIAQKLCRIEGLSYNRATRLADGGWRYEIEECGYWCDLETGRPSASLRNPFTGRNVTPRPYRSPQINRFHAMRVESLAQNLPEGLVYRGEIAPPIRVGETLFMTEDLFVQTPPVPPRGGQPGRASRVQTSMATFSASIATLRPTGFVPADFSYSTMNSFVPWLDMAGIAGVQNMRLVGRKAIDTRNAAPWLIAQIERDHPDFLTKDGRTR